MLVSILGVKILVRRAALGDPFAESLRVFVMRVRSRSFKDTVGDPFS